MPRGYKTKHIDKQEREADHIADQYEDKGVSSKEAERRAWATVNKDDGGGKKLGSGCGAHASYPPAHKGGAKGGEASAYRWVPRVRPQQKRQRQPASGTLNIMRTFEVDA